MRPTKLLFFALLTLLLALPAAAQDTAMPGFEPAECWFPVLAGRAVECGYVTVPEDHFDAGSASTIQLAVAIFRATGDNPAADPIFYLEGGPGGSALQLTAPFFDLSLGDYNVDRDVIVFDQRGVGLSRPALDCPEFIDGVFSAIRANLPVEEEQALLVDSVQACAQRLVSEGVNLSAYTSAQNAADINSLRQILGYEQINLLGSSYGARLALTVMRDFPQILRSVVISSIYPPQVSLYLDAPANTMRVLDTLFAGCAADPACSAAYPDLETVFFDLVERLNAEPVTLTLTNPRTGDSVEALVNGDELILGTFFNLYVTSLIPNMPQAIYDAVEGDYSGVAGFLGVYLAVEPFISRGMYFSVTCNEEVPFSTSDQFRQELAAFPELESYFTRSSDFSALCAVWDSGTAAPIENEPVTSSVPALLISGEYDPVTPPGWGEAAVATLSSGYHYVIPGAGHDAGSNACAASIAQAFLADPTAAPDTACIAAIEPVRFSTPDKTVTLEAFTSATFGISGVIPAGWQEIAPGVYAESATAAVALLQQAIPGDESAVTGLLQTQLGLSEFPASSGTRTANGLTWTLYELTVQGQPARLAVTAQDGTAYLVLLIGGGQAEINAIFLPAVDALTPAP